MSALHERIRRALDESGASQRELADYCRVKPPSVSEWLSGRTATLKAEPLVLAAEFLNVRPRWLAFGEGPMRSDQQPGVAPIGPLRPAWPFKQITEAQVCNLPVEDLLRLEGAILALLSQLGAERKRRAA